MQGLRAIQAGFQRRRPLACCLLLLLSSLAVSSLAQQPADIAAKASDVALNAAADTTVQPSIVGDVSTTSPGDAAPVVPCGSEQQIIMCGEIPFSEIEARQACCYLYRYVEPTAEVQAAVAAASDAAEVTAAAATNDRPDLDALGATALPPPWNYTAKCLRSTQASIPSFAGTSNGAPIRLTVPILNSTIITKIKAEALAVMRTSMDTLWVVTAHNNLRRVNTSSRLIHPGIPSGPAELPLLSYRLSKSIPLTTTARTSLLTGTGVPPKVFQGGWFPPTGTRISTDYTGPYAMASVQSRYGGLDGGNGSACPANYPSSSSPGGAPKTNCGHVTWVELDGAQIYRNSIAWWATNQTVYAQSSHTYIKAWVNTNAQWGWWRENGPLEAGWGVAAVAKALELLKYKKAFPGYEVAVVNKFITWFRTVVLPQINWLMDSAAARAAAGQINVYNNCKCILQGLHALHRRMGGVLPSPELEYRQMWPSCLWVCSNEAGPTAAS